MKIYVITWNVCGIVRLPAAYMNYEDAEKHIHQMSIDRMTGVYKICEVIVS